MQYREVFQLPDVYSYRLQDNLLAYSDMSGRITVCDVRRADTTLWSVKVDHPAHALWFDDVLYVRSTRGHGANYFFTKHGHPIQVPDLGTDFSLEWFANFLSGRVLGYTTLDSKIQVGLFDTRDLRFLWSKDLRIATSLQTENIVFGVLFPNRWTMVALTADRGELIWTLSVKEHLAQLYANDQSVDIENICIEKLVSVHEHVLSLIVSIEVGKHKLLGIDVRSGKIIWTCEVDLKMGYNVQPVADGSKIFSLHGFNKYQPDTQFVEVDVVTGRLIRAGTVPSLLNEGIVVKNWAIHDDRIYYQAIQNEKYSTHAGVLRYSDLEVLWHAKITMDSDAFFAPEQRPAVTGDRFLILDTHEDLHFLRYTP